MRKMLVLIAVLTVTVDGCSEGSAQHSPIAASPAPTLGSLASLSGVVIGETGSCIADATVLVVGGQRTGQRVAQTTPCSYWDYGGGFEFKDLTPGVEMTLRASAPGYVAKEMTLRPSTGPTEQQVVFPLDPTK